MKRLISVLSFLMLCPLTPTWAQLYPPNETGVSMGHWGTIVRDVDAAKKFWIVLGAKPIKIDDTDVMELPGVLIFLTPGTPIGGNEETVLGHFGFGVPSVQKAFEKFKVAGLKIREPRKSPLNGQDMGNVFTLDNLNVEVTEEAGVAPYPVIAPNLTIESNHAHFFVPESSQKEIADWYVKTFGAIPGSRGNILTGDIPGVKFLNWNVGKFTPVPSKGRVLDHMGFEVKNLEAFCKKLQANGVKLDAPYSKTRHKSFASAELTDPLGTSIVLTEGLNKF